MWRWPMLLAILLWSSLAGASVGERQGAVVACEPSARAPAAELARLVYADPALRPAIDEGVAWAALGAPWSGRRAADVAALTQGAAEAKSDLVRRRLLQALADELGAAHVIWVRAAGAEVTATVHDARAGQLLALWLVPRVDPKTARRDWRDAVALLRGLAAAKPAPGPRRSPAPTPKTGGPVGEAAPPAPPDGGRWRDLLKSPWFWGGLGLVVTVGITVLVLSQTALAESDTVVLEGRVAP